MPDHYTLLLEWRRSEAAARGLAKLPHDFYPATTAYLAEIRRTYESELRENPSGRKGELSRQTYQRAGQVARDIVEARMTKILSQAFQASVGGAKELPNSLPEERALFESIVGVLGAHRGTVAPFLTPLPSTGEAPARAPVGAPAKPAAPPAAAPAVPAPPAKSFVRIVRESRAMEIGSETLDLRKEDLLSLPEASARLLVDGRIAERVESRDPP
ncbi:MAG TPA: hypothetical protein VGV64_05270 [Thermoplasmata archaeon]|nr:hypothetical protein [Thermoplasmata archaeon]